MDTKNTETSTEEIAIAIDFGTSNSGYAWGPIREGHGMSIHIREDWPGQAFHYAKTPTAILIKAECMDSLNSIDDLSASRIREWLDTGKLYYGYSALDTFADRDGVVSEPKKWCLFERFKMKLRKGEKEVTSEGDGKSYSLGVVIGLLLAVFKVEAVKNISRANPAASREEKCRWAVTIPAIWKQAEADFMRQICEKTVSPNVRLIHEPEAAAISMMKKLGLLTQAGRKVMVIDVGGGTCDIELYVIEERKGRKYALKELIPSGGAPSGGTLVDTLFWLFLSQKMAEKAGVWERWNCDAMTARENLIDAFWKENRRAKVKWEQQWEFRKREIQDGVKASEIETKPMHFDLICDNTRYRAWLEKNHSEVYAKLYDEDDGITMHLSVAEIKKQVFLEAIERILSVLTTIHKDAYNLSKVDDFLLVGGFAASEWLRQEVSDLIFELSGKRLQALAPKDAGSAILDGAVYSLANPFYISKIAKLNYYLSIKSKNDESAMHSIVNNYCDICGIYDIDKVPAIIEKIGERYLYEKKSGWHQEDGEGWVPYLMPILIKGHEIRNYSNDRLHSSDSGESALPIYATSDDHVYSEDSPNVGEPLIVVPIRTRGKDKMRLEILFEDESKAEFHLRIFDSADNKVADEKLPVNIVYGSTKSND